MTPLFITSVRICIYAYSRTCAGSVNIHWTDLAFPCSSCRGACCDWVYVRVHAWWKLYTVQRATFIMTCTCTCYRYCKLITQITHLTEQRMLLHGLCVCLHIWRIPFPGFISCVCNLCFLHAVIKYYTWSLQYCGNTGTCTCSTAYNHLNCTRWVRICSHRRACPAPLLPRV